ncbi:MAG: hypothetical protein ACK5O2_14390 [Microthrixaceae bacterium]
MAQRRHELPVLTGHFEEGRFSLGAMRCAERVATVDNEAEVAEVAIVATSPQASRTYAAFRAAAGERTRRRESHNSSADDPVGDQRSNAMDPEEPVERGGPAEGDPGVWLRIHRSENAPGTSRSGSGRSKIAAFERLLLHAGDALADADVRGRWEDRFALSVLVEHLFKATPLERDGADSGQPGARTLES